MKNQNLLARKSFQKILRKRILKNIIDLRKKLTETSIATYFILNHRQLKIKTGHSHAQLFKAIVNLFSYKKGPHFCIKILVALSM